jgi:hypothetical protein
VLTKKERESIRVGFGKLLRLNQSVLFGSIRGDVLRTLGREMSAENFAKKFKKLAHRDKVPVLLGTNFHRMG